MPCYRPLEAWKTVQGAVVFNKGQGNKNHDIQSELLLACGQCVGCRLERSRQWAIRCTHERQMHEEACFLTLTYTDENLPTGGTLDHKHIQIFVRKLRKKLSQSSNKRQTDCDPIRTELQLKKKKKIRYYMCGEYGEKTQRPHYHMCLYGWEPTDKKYYTTSGSKIKSKIYTSETLDKLWGKGKVWTGEVTFESAAYTARYIMKKITGQAATKHYETVDTETGEIINRKPEYTKMSLKPGIGATWLKKYKSDVFPEGTVIARGHKSKSPKFYDKKYKKLDPIGYEEMQWRREASAIAGENSKERLAVRETVAKAQIAFLKRNAH